ncbi:MAG TPA: DUF177 domain-containing protein [Stellaceae bacterium]|nr:DUF177 domain-containing protein [Stellaceae bacterium]
MSIVPEFSRPVLLARIGSEPLRREIVATAAEREALARRFDLLALDWLTAKVELIRRSGDMMLLRAAFDAAFVQECVVTLDPIEGVLSAEFELLYGPAEAEEAAAGVLGDAVAFEPLDGEAIDIGEAVAQEFSLALPPFPRTPDADTAITEPSAEAAPMAALAQFFARRRDD